MEPQKHFDTVLYTGNGSSNGDVQRISSLQFDPDFVWIKSRSVSSTHNQVFNIISSVGGDKALALNLTAAEYSFSDFDFLNNGFNAPYSSSASYSCNTNSATYVAWCWKAGGSAVANNDGSISSQVSVNRKAGFSIVAYTGTGSAGATVGHGLGVKPAWIICKSRSTTSDWRVYHQSLGNTTAIKLNENGQAYASTTYWNDTSPTSTTVSLGTETDLNGSGRTHIMYCWNEIPGYSKID